MNELQRAEYLSALGVVNYMPRFVLPFAPEPRQAELPVVDDRDSGRAVPVADPEPNPGASAKPANLGIADAITPESRVLSPEPKAESPESRKPAELHRPDVSSTAPTELAPTPFILSCWWLGEELLTVDSREPGAALPVESLFNNIARALNWHQLPREQDRLKWPLAENRFGPAASASEARETCSAWLEAACARRPVKSIWLMGRQAQDFCAPSPLEQPVSDWNGIRVLAAPSLSQLLREPQRKRELWQLLRETYPEQTRSR